MQRYLMPFVSLLNEMAPYLLLGFLIAGLLHAFVPRGIYARYLSRNDFRSVLLSALFGIPLPLCSCGVIPTAMSMRREGASRAATVSFLISTPQTGVDSILATGSLLGLPFALLRPVAALCTALFGGGLVAALTPADTPSELAGAAADKGGGFLQRCRTALRYGFVEMMQDIGKWLVIGLLAAGAITIFVPDGFFAAWSDRPLASMLLVLLLSVPMYLCATGSVPIAAALMLKGLSPGAALVLLMAGPATNLAAILVIGKVLGRRTLLLYLAAIVGGAVGFGLAVDYLLPGEWFAHVSVAAAEECCAGSFPWWKTASSVLLVVLLAAAFFARKRHHEPGEPPCDAARTLYRVEGMTCNHCKANVERAVAAVAGVRSATVDLAAGTACIEGDADPARIVAAIEGLGFRCTRIDR